MAWARQSIWRFRLGVFIAAGAFAEPALAGPPYLSNDPIPRQYQHFEIYALAAGDHAREGEPGAVGVDFNHGATPDLQLSAVLPAEYERPRGATDDLSRPRHPPDLVNRDVAGAERRSSYASALFNFWDIG